MRWWLGRRPGPCTVCGAELERGAAWCGACGARADAAAPGDDDQVAVAEPGPHPDVPAGDPRPSRHRVLVAALVLAGLAAAAVAQGRDGPAEPAEPVLGRLDQHTGMSATGPPPSGLRLAWAHDPPDRNGSLVSGPPQWIMVRGDTARLGNQVVDLDTGHLQRVAASSGPHLAAESAVVEAGELVVLDQLTGAVTSRTTVAGEWQHHHPWNSGRSGGVSLFGGERSSVLVADDGSVLAEVDGRLFGGADRAGADPAAFPLRTVAGGDFDAQLTAPVRLVAAATGEVVLDLPDTRVRVVDVVGELAMVASTDARVDSITSPAAITDLAWTVRLLDAGSGQEWARLDLESREAPRLVGTFADGAAVLIGRSGDEFPLWVVAADGSASPVARAQPPPGRGGGRMLAQSSALDAAAVTGDVLAVSVGEDGVVGLDRAGRGLWRLDAPDLVALRGHGGHLAVVPDDDGRTRVVRAADGEVVARLSTPAPRWLTADTPLAALAGHVGLGRGHGFDVQDEVLDETTWLDLRTGQPAALQDVFGSFLPDDATDGLDRSWQLHGTVAASAEGDHGQTDEQPADRAVPVMTRAGAEGVLEVLEPGQGPTRFRLSDPVEHREGSGRLVRSLGADAGRLALWSESHTGRHGPATHVLDRTTGEVTTIEGVHGIALSGDLLVAVEVDEDFTTAALVGVDAATGQRRWTGPPREPRGWGGSPRVDRKLLLDVGVARVTATSLRDGAQAWTHASDTELTDHSVLGPRRAVVATATGEVVALDRDDGDVVWRSRVGSPIAAITGAGGHVLVGTSQGVVVHLDGRGREVQRIAVGTEAVDAVAALGDTVVATVGGRVVGLRADGTGITRRDEVPLP